ncbi:MAG: hypothetical protein M3314_15790 [Actinomycetota bacterium]|nr:hypothetical protein [Actinomycetota bacterium]
MDRLRTVFAVAVVVTAGAMVVVLASVGVACTNLATISLSSGAGHPGDTISVTGTSFPVRSQLGLTPTPVEIHWRSADGPLLATVTPDRTGTISSTFTIPESAPGPVVIIATQRRTVVNPNTPDAPPILTDEFGTPARATLRVLAPGERATTIVAGSEFAPLTADSGSTAVMVMLVLFGAVALSLFGGGVIAFLHQVRERRLVPQPRRSW